MVGLGEANLLAALSMGRRFGLVTIDPVFIDWHERQVHAHGLDQRFAGVRAIHMDLPGFIRAFTDEASYTQVRADFIEQVRPLVAQGAEVIIPAGGLPMLLFARECPFVIDGALVLRLLRIDPPPLQSLDEAGLSPQARAFYAENRRVANGKARRVLYWEPRFADFRAGLRDCLRRSSP